MVAIPTILVSGVILAGGEVDIDFKNMKFTGRCNSLLDAVKKTHQSFQKETLTQRPPPKLTEMGNVDDMVRGLRPFQGSRDHSPKPRVAATLGYVTVFSCTLKHLNHRRTSLFYPETVNNPFSTYNGAPRTLARPPVMG